MIQFYCVSCGSRIETNEDRIGSTIDCPSCDARVTVPKPEPSKVNQQKSDHLTENGLHWGTLIRKRLRLVLGICLVSFLAMGALAGILSTLSNEFGEFQVKVMLTAMSLGGYSFAALCSSLLIDKPGYQPFSILGLVLSAVGATFAVITNWELVQGWELVLKGRFTLLTLAFAHAHATLLLMIDSDNPLVQGLRWMVLVTIVLLTFVVVSLIHEHWQVAYLSQALSIVVILDVFGTLSIPILHFATRKG